MKTYTVTEYEKEDYNKIKEEMTIDDVIHLLSWIERGWIPDYNFTGTESDFDAYRLHMALNKSISILEDYKKGL